MVQLERGNTLIYEDIERSFEYEITKGPMITYILGKNKH